ncbi:MAG: GyrI-like domain-containing protein [Anaerolineales bacterium]
MEKVDLKKELKSLYNPSAKTVSMVDVPAFNFLMIDGHGNPNTAPEYAQALEALYALAYTLKFKIKKGATGVDYAVMPLEGLWWVEDMDLFSVASKDDWLWTMMIAQPRYVTAELFAEALGEVEKKKGPVALSKARFEAYHEGPSAQIMYFGPYADEGPTIAKIHAFIRESGCQLQGKHHEIYLGDPRKSAPEKLRTVIRQPFK